MHDAPKEVEAPNRAANTGGSAQSKANTGASNPQVSRNNNNSSNKTGTNGTTNRDPCSFCHPLGLDARHPRAYCWVDPASQYYKKDYAERRMANAKKGGSNAANFTLDGVELEIGGQLFNLVEHEKELRAANVSEEMIAGFMADLWLCAD